MGWLSLVPVVIAIIMALLTKDTVVSLTIACIIGCFMRGDGLFGFTNLLYEALGNTDTIWIFAMVILFSVMVTYFERSGAIEGFTKIVQNKKVGRKGVQLISWFLGLFCFADSMSPLFVGSVMKNLSDNERISREKLSYIADATASPLSVIHPFSSWTPYLASLAVGYGLLNGDTAYKFALKAIPFNFYAILSVLMVALIGLGVIKDFGPMKKAEKRAMETGKLLEDGAVPLTTEGSVGSCLFSKPRVFLNFILPVFILLIVCCITVVLDGEPAICEAAMLIVVLMSVSFLIQGLKLKDLNQVFLTGVKNAMPAIMVLAVSYPLNTLTQEMGLSDFVVNSLGKFMNPSLLPVIVFVFAAVLSFASGTSWGTYAILTPLVLPWAFSISGNEITSFVLLCFSAVAGGGVFGDHCSPLSDTTILASMGSGADHIDHVRTQLPYAITCAGVAAVLYLVLGLIFV